MHTPFWIFCFTNSIVLLRILMKLWSCAQMLFETYWNQNNCWAFECKHESIWIHSEFKKCTLSRNVKTITASLLPNTFMWYRVKTSTSKSLWQLQLTFFTFCWHQQKYFPYMRNTYLSYDKLTISPITIIYGRDPVNLLDLKATCRKH